jgi:TP901 family phage tail tape measure protein
MSSTPDINKPDEYPWALEELAAAIAVFSHANVRSTRGGKALREAMATLLRPSELTTQTIERLKLDVYHDDGRLRALSDLVGALESANPPHADYWRIFGIQSGATMSQLVRYGARTLHDLAAQVRVSDDAELLLSDTRELVGDPPRYNRLQRTQQEPEHEG